MNYQEILENIYHQLKDEPNKGELATYIPELARINPDKFGISLQFLKGEVYQVGDACEKFSNKLPRGRAPEVLSRKANFSLMKT